MRRVLILSAVLLIAASCSGDDKDDVAATGRSSTTEAGAVTTVAGETTTVAGAGAAGATGGTTKGTTKAAGPTVPSGTAPPPPAEAGTKFTAAGKYTYRITGKSNNQPVDFESILTVDPPNGAHQHSTQTVPQGSTEQVQRSASDGIYLVSLLVKAGIVAKEFRPNNTALIFPLPPTVNRAWSWSATSTDGKTTVNSAFKLLRKETITVGGQAVEAWVVEAKTSTSGDFRSTSDRLIWVSEPLRLILRTDEKGDAAVGGSQTSARLQSTTPS